MAKTIFDASKINDATDDSSSSQDRRPDDFGKNEDSVVKKSQVNAPMDSSTSPSQPKSQSKSHSSKETVSHMQAMRNKARAKAGQGGEEGGDCTHREPKDYSQVLREDGTSSGWLSSYVSLPKHAHFETQHESETILMLLRQHPVVFIPKIAILVGLILMPIIIFPLFPIFVYFPAQINFFTFVGWYIFTAIFAIEAFLDWYYNIYIITDERIIDIDFYSLIYKSVSEAKISNIEDVTATTAGVLGATLNYGNITIQTAAEKREFEFLKVPRPARVTKFLNELMLEEELEELEGRVM